MASLRLDFFHNCYNTDLKAEIWRKTYIQVVTLTNDSNIDSDAWGGWENWKEEKFIVATITKKKISQTTCTKQNKQINHW